MTSITDIFTETNLDLPNKQQGKVRDSYSLPKHQRLMVTTDRLSAFDQILGAVPYKGQVLNQLSAWWFAQTADIMANHFISMPDPNASIVRAAKPFTIEVIVRGYISGVTGTALWRRYELGERTIYGYQFPEGLRKNQKLPDPIITPTTKGGPTGHDERLTCAEVVSKGLLDQQSWDQVQGAALAIFKRGQELAGRAGLLLVDTKYEFGFDENGKIIIIDELHTPDSSRYWIEKTYAQRIEAGEEPENFDKEFIRLAYASQGYKGDGIAPPMPDSLWLAASERYIEIYERLTGEKFMPGEYPVEPRLIKNLECRGILRMPTDAHKDDKPKEECGVLGIYSSKNDAARLAYFGLYALQHRGQEAAGIAVSDGEKILKHKGLGLVSQVFNEDNLSHLPGFIAIGHTRYSTTGASSLRNAQPFLIDTQFGPLAMAHNGNLTNAAQLRDEILKRGVGLAMTSDSGVMMMMLAGAIGNSWEERLQQIMPQWQGAYSLTFVMPDRLIAVRDPWGFRPLSVGKLSDGGYAVASETGALQTLACHDIREINPGEIISITKQGLESIEGQAPKTKSALCVFEQIYFSRPDSVWDKMNVHQFRQRLGEVLAEETKIEADIVIPVPDSAIPAAIGYARTSGIPYNDGFIKNRYIGRTFIQPTDSLRKQGVALKFNALASNLEGKRVIVIDDSIVRGNTSGPLVKLLRQAGASEVHMCITSPPIKHPCFMGIDMGTYDELIAHKMTVEEIRQHIGCDTLHYLSLEGVERALDSKTNYCNACFTGNYPVPIYPQTQTIPEEKMRKE
ncbi:MAG: amidophosphoribosyltransferase [Gammaproteobacteria bacterium]|nr:amidophosphoribosyltransferase [Gammaproteobacteria bacterium]